MSGTDGAPGYPCSMCGAYPAFLIGGEEPLCYKHLPWNKGKNEREIDEAIAAIVGSRKPPTMGILSATLVSSGSVVDAAQPIEEKTQEKK